MSSRSDDERFAAMIAAEFPDGVTFGERQVAAATPDPEPEPVASPPEPPEGGSTGFRTWSAPEEEAEGYRPVPPTPSAGWSNESMAGTALILFGLLTVVLSGLGVNIPAVVSVLSGAAVFGGAGLLLYRLSRRPPREGDGAVL